MGAGLQHAFQHQGLPQGALGEGAAGGAAGPQAVHVELHGSVGGDAQPAAAARPRKDQAAAQQERAAAAAVSDGSMVHGR